MSHTLLGASLILDAPLQKQASSVQTFRGVGRKVSTINPFLKGKDNKFPIINVGRPLKSELHLSLFALFPTEG